MTAVAELVKIDVATVQHEDLDIADIVIGDRFRKDLGDIAELAGSIKRQGLLQPVGVNENNELVFGERRIRAFQSLGWSRIPVRRVGVTSIVEGEHDENEIRKDFTPSERVAIAEAVAEGLGERRGRPADGYTDNCPALGETRDIVATRSGFSSGKQYERAKTVVTADAPELVAAMDAGKVSISAAATISKQDIETQKRIVAEDNMKRKASELRSVEAELARVKAIPRPAPRTPEERAKQEEVFGTKEDRLVWSNLNEVMRIISEQPAAGESVGRIPPSLHHAIDIKEIRKAAVWLYDFANEWETIHVA